MNLSKSQASQDQLSEILFKFRREIASKKVEADAASRIIERIESWVSTQPELTQVLCDYVVQYALLIIKGNEESIVDFVVKKEIVSDWKHSLAAAHLNRIEQALMEDERKDSALITYIQILQRGAVLANNSPEQSLLIRSGLIRVERDYLKVANVLYTKVFDLKKIEQMLPGITKPVAVISPQAVLDSNPSKTSKLYSKLAIAACGLAVLSAAIASYVKESGGEANANNDTALVENTINSAPEPLLENQADTASNTRNLADSNLSASAAQLPNLSKLDSFDQVRNVPTGAFEYGGSTTWAPIRKEIDSAIQSTYFGYRLQYTSPATDSGRAAGSGTGIRMLLDDELMFSQSSRPLNETEREEARSKGYELQQVAIAIDGIAIATNPALNVPGLTMAQLKKIYTGEIKNWQEVGGPYELIVPLARRLQDSGTVELFGETVLEGAQMSPNVQFVENTTAAVRKVSDMLGGIYYASAPEIIEQCAVRPLPMAKGTEPFVAPYVAPYIEASECPRYRNQLNAAQFQNGDYPLTRKLFVIIKQNGQIEEEVGVAYANFLLTAEGQRLIKRTGFVETGSR